MVAVAGSTKPSSIASHSGSPPVRAGVAYGAAASISTVAAFILLRLWRADLRVPFDYGGDWPLHGMVVKAIVEHGRYLTNPNLGAPGGLELYDYPLWADDTLHLLVIRVMALFSGDWALVANLHFILGFPAITLCSMAVLRRLGIGYGPAAVGGVLYSFLPARVLSGEGHLFVEALCQVPLLALVLVWVCSDDPPLVAGGDRSGRIRLQLGSARSMAALALCVLCGLSSLRYSYFGACLLALGGAWAALDRGLARNALSGALLAAVLGVVVVANGLPTWADQVRHGRNEAATAGLAGEVHGLRIAELLVPVRGHRVAALARLNRLYHAGDRPSSGEPRDTSLGSVGAAGFVGLLALLVVRRRSPSRDDPLTAIVALNGLALLVATVGGLGSLVALHAIAQFRAYAGMHVIIAFFAIFAAALALDRLERKEHWLGVAASVAVLVLGLLDQASRAAVPSYEGVRRKYESDGDLVARIEAALGPGAIVFELPYVAFPGGPGLEGLGPYDLFRPYLHSRTLRWTYPGMRGRASDVWARDVSTRAPAAMLEALAAQDVKGVLIHRAGYPDPVPAVERDLQDWLHARPRVSKDGLLSFFDLSKSAVPGWLAELPPAQRARASELAYHPVAFRWNDGCYDLEKYGPQSTFRWCSNRGRIGIHNELGYPRRLTIRSILVPATGPAHLKLDGLLSVTLDLSPAGTSFEATIQLPPGDHEVRFVEDGAPIDAPADPRTLAWKVRDFAVEETTSLE
jgi:phosphoglycerol transferase